MVKQILKGVRGRCRMDFGASFHEMVYDPCLDTDRGVIIRAMLADIIERERERQPSKAEGNCRGLQRNRRARWTKENVLAAIRRRLD